MLENLWEIIGKIEGYLPYLGYPSIPVILNIATINLKLQRNESPNSTLLIWPSGCGKGSLLEDVLGKSNPKFFPQLPQKLYESEIMEFPDDYFNKKIWVYEDLITLFRGTSTKQREQLMNFFNIFLSRGWYARRERKVEGKIVCCFGVAREFYEGKYKKEMFQLTFLDRFNKVYFELSEKMKAKILKLRNMNKEMEPPKVKLPFYKNDVRITIPEKFTEEINKLALDWDRRKIMSFVRAQISISNFLKASALLNNRREVTQEDLMLLKFVLPLYYRETKPSQFEVMSCIFRHSLKLEKVSASQIKKEVTSIEERRIEQILKGLREKGSVFYEQKGNEFEYWLW
jgi:hypothetical protein